ncbi:response regulator [Tistlia consotensis]|uniref:response regulator n=1 Tax=Tistlia consotensis TaxID=1321365 RepID=UPI0013564CBD|nr:response regulator [Tistlia consotensis]
MSIGVGRERFPSALVVEASAGQARFTSDLMRGMGFDHVWVGVDSATAFADLHELTPDLLILAVDVEPLDGLALARTIRSAAQPAIRNVPIIFLTPHATEPQVSEVRAIRRSALLVKPPSPESLRNHIAMLMRTGKPGTSGASPVRAVP